VIIFTSFNFSFATAGNTVVTLAIFLSSVVLLVCAGCGKVRFPWHANINSIQHLWDTLYLDISLLVVMIWTEASG
jgi:hypothetical protein